MESKVLVMARALKHGLTEDQVIGAWQNHIGKVLRIDRSDGAIDFKTIGFSKEGHAIEVTARAKPYGLLIYHATTPPTERALRELGLKAR